MRTRRVVAMCMREGPGHEEYQSARAVAEQQQGVILRVKLLLLVRHLLETEPRWKGRGLQAPAQEHMRSRVFTLSHTHRVHRVLPALDAKRSRPHADPQAL